MTARNELVDVALETLESFGIKGEVVPRGKHIEIVWFVGEQRRSTIVAATPSDHRAWLNVRGEVRRALRADNVQPAPKEKVLSFKTALSLPRPVTLPIDRIKALEEDVVILLDWLVEERARADALEAKLNGLRVILSFEGSTVSQASAQPFTQSALPTLEPVRKGGPSDLIMAALANGAWAEKKALLKATGLSDAMLSSTLNYLKSKRGLVENGLRGFWRKTPANQANTG